MLVFCYCFLCSNFLPWRILTYVTRANALLLHSKPAVAPGNDGKWLYTSVHLLALSSPASNCGGGRLKGFNVEDFEGLKIVQVSSLSVIFTGGLEKLSHVLFFRWVLVATSLFWHDSVGNPLRCLNLDMFFMWLCDADVSHVTLFLDRRKSLPLRWSVCSWNFAFLLGLLRALHCFYSFLMRVQCCSIFNIVQRRLIISWTLSMSSVRLFNLEYAWIDLFCSQSLYKFQINAEMVMRSRRKQCRGSASLQ